MWIIENDYLKVQCRAQGAELTSIKDKSDYTEHLWQADPAYWGWHAPVLFPVVGRCFGDVLSIKQEKYNMEKHGFARKSLFKLEKLENHSISFSLVTNEQTKAIYPYDFLLQITYTLDDHKLITTYTLANHGEEKMFYSLGAHPAVAAPFFEGENYTDYFIEFPNDKELERHFINESGFFTGEKKEVLSSPNKLQLHPTIFEDDALIFKEINSKTIYLKSAKHAKFLSFSFPDFEYLGIWAKNHAGYVCVEPWLGCADADGFEKDIAEKEGIQVLEPFAKKSVDFTIGINK